LCISFLKQAAGTDTFYLPGYRSMYGKVLPEIKTISSYLDSTDVSMIYYPERFLYSLASS
jgi:hypothetical protein